jgi:5-methylcytosine-specific restriction endonuclease McrA
MPTKICPTCGKEFHPSQTETRYCSPQCFAATRKGVALKPRVPHICKQCGKEFGQDVKPSRIESEFCSTKCWQESRKEIRTCPVCDKTFSVPKVKPKFCCSYRCGQTYKMTRIETTCLWCGKLFTSHISGKRQYCSLECFYQTYPHKHEFIYRGKNWLKQAQRARERDGFKCQICGKSLKSKRGGAHVHHIKRFRLFNGDYKRANELSNLITLCRSCHIRVERHGYPCPQPLL